jgi:hypothetical protein
MIMLHGMVCLLTASTPTHHQFSPCRQRIEDAVSESLSSDDSLSTPQAADALAAICALNSLDTSAALQQLLARRRAWVRSLLQAHLDQLKERQEGEQDAESRGAPQGRHADVQAVADLLSRVAQALQLTICQVGSAVWVLSALERGTCCQWLRAFAKHRQARHEPGEVV